MSAGILDRVWDGADETWQWLRGVVMGEWEDDRSTSQIVTDAIAGFVPGVGSVITLRDLIAVIVRLAKHPEKRAQVEEWILLVAMLLPLIITVAGVAVAGVGALVGAELGGFLRATALLVVKKGGVAFKAMVEFFQAHGYGDVFKALRQVKFAQYRGALVKGLSEQIDKLVKLVQGFEAKLRALHPESLPVWLPGRQSVVNGIAHCQVFVKQLEALRKAAVEMIPKALIEMDQRLSALLAGNLKAATQVTHSVATGREAPAVAKLKQEPSAAGKSMRNPEPPEPGNTRRVAERRTVALMGTREYKAVDKSGRPVGAKPYKAGETRFENPPATERNWDKARGNVEHGWPDMGKEYAPGTRSTDYDTFSGEIRPASAAAGSNATFDRLVSHEKPDMDTGAFYNRKLPIDGEDMRANSAIKESWNNNGEYVQMRVPLQGDPVWKELHALQEKSAGGPIAYREELKFWEGPAASQLYKKQDVSGKWVDDDWYLPGGKPQQMFDRDQMALLKVRGFIGPRKPTNFSDFDPVVGTIVPKDGVFLEVVPLHEAVPYAAKK